MFPDLVSLRRRRSSKWVQHPPDVLPAFVAEMDVALAPPVAAALLAAVELGDTGYAEPGRLFEEFAGFARRRFGWDPNPGRMVLMPDVMTGIVELLRVLTAPGAGVVITPPVYPPFFDGIPEAGRRVVEVPLAGGELDLDALEAAFAALGERHAVVLSSASKAFNLAGLKCAIAVAGSSEIARRLERLPSELRYRAGILGVVASQAAFESGDAWLDDLLASLDGNRRRLAELLEERLPAIRYEPPEASFLAWLDCRALGLGDDPAAAFLERGRVALEAGTSFGTPGRGFARLNIGTSEELLDAAVGRIAAAVSGA